MIKIAPSILSADFANLERDIQRISTADYVHVDVMDGMFVPNITIGIPVVKSIRPTTALPLDVHLMIVEPGRYVEQFCDAGADLVTVHVESDTEEKLHDAIARIHAKGKRAGIVLKPGTPAEAALPYLEQVELGLTDEEQQLLSEPIDRWGKAWQKFMTENYPEEIPSLEGRLKWELIPRQIDKEAWEMWELLRKQYAEKNPRPKTTFTEIERWEKTRSFIVEHEVMEQIVLQRRG